MSIRPILACLLLAALAGCAQLPRSGPNAQEVAAIESQPGAGAIQVVDVTGDVTARLLAQRRLESFAESFRDPAVGETRIGFGDAVEISIWEAPPATLFGGGTSVLPGVPATASTTTLPAQVVDRDGFVSVPFAGRIRAAGQTLAAVESEIARRLRGKANQPEVLLRMARVGSSSVTVVGEVGASVRMPLTPSGERLLDALAAAGGVRAPVNKATIQLTRGSIVQSLPLDQVIREPQQNVLLQPGDVVTALSQPFSFTALGATGRNEEIAFEAQGITLAQGLARAGGLSDARANPEGVFLFRLEPRGALDWPRQPVQSTADGLVPVVYRLNLRDPASFFVMQNFALRHKDILYVANAPASELQKFLNLVVSALFPVLNLINTTR